jgi:hypothetical protein
MAEDNPEECTADKAANMADRYNPEQRIREHLRYVEARRVSIFIKRS